MHLLDHQHSKFTPLTANHEDLLQQLGQKITIHATTNYVIWLLQINGTAAMMILGYDLAEEDASDLSPKLRMNLIFKRLRS